MNYNYTGNMSFEDVYHDCKLIADSIVDEESFQQADTGLLLFHLDRILEALDKQVGKEMIKKFDDKAKTNWCVCPVCFKGLGWEHTEHARSRYCPKYGQKLKNGDLLWR